MKYAVIGGSMSGLAEATIKELKKKVFSAGNVLRIFFEDETGEIKSYSKKYGKEERKPYEIRHLINNLIDEEMTL